MTLSYKRLQNAITKRLESADEPSVKADNPSTKGHSTDIISRQHVPATIVPQLSEEEVVSNYKQTVLGHMRNIIHNQKNEESTNV
ncbi:hypothetical protein [Pseudomonas putida]|uniref:Uncharacterized protein n=1 Tax=Pseudomonas putida TaxID=303 RepID=A0A6I7ERZ5_PSEPU|nr:hypothetical protein [Pseudomonas putida]QHW08375.1 hypothetical protein C2H86_28425 [Pseudomonas putida]